MDKNLLNKWKTLYLLQLVTHHDKDRNDNHNDDYDNCNTSKVDETTFSVNKEATLTLRL